jgi:apolipoprotein N-acyltransferase
MPAPLVAIVVSGGLFYVSTGLNTFWPAAWIAPIAILVVAFTRSWPVAAGVAASAYLLGSLNLFGLLRTVMPAPVVALTLLLPALLFAAVVLVARRAAPRLPPWAASLAFPATWTALEFLSSMTSPHGTVMSLAYSQTDVLPLLQIAAVAGVFGITFVLTLVPSAIAVAYVRRAWSALIPAAVAVAVVFGFGFWRLQQPLGATTVRVGLAAADARQVEAFATEDAAVAQDVARGYAARIARLAASGAQVVVLPEKIVGLTFADASDVLKIFGDAARTSNVTVIVGLNRVSEQPMRNVAAVFAPDGTVRLEYDKHHMLPGPETGYVIGSRVGTFDAPGGPWGTAICKDLDFQEWLRRYGESGVRLLAVPAWDFGRDARFHSRMAVVRAVENGFTLARAATRGLLTVSDAHGRILREQPSDRPPDSLLIQDVGPGPGTTFYTRAGNWLGWTSVGLAILLTLAPRSGKAR